MSPDAAITLRIRRTPYGAPAVERLVVAVGARADLPVERLDEARLLAAVAVREAWGVLAADVMELRIGSTGGRVVVDIGPFQDGGAERVAQSAPVPGAGGVVDRLASGWSARSGEDGSRRLEILIG
ncbi:MAG: hypothetical protein AB7V42_08390 [Thermoleophilia bacterium]